MQNRLLSVLTLPFYKLITRKLSSEYNLNKSFANLSLDNIKVFEIIDSKNLKIVRAKVSIDSNFELSNQHIGRIGKLIKIDGNGDCFFSAVGKALHISSMKVREKIADYLKLNSWLISIFIDTSNELLGAVNNAIPQTVALYLEKLTTPGNWAEELEIGISHLALNCCIEIFTETGYFLRSSDASVKVSLLYDIDLHYDLINFN